MKKIVLSLSLICPLFLAGCPVANNPVQEERMTVAKAQREIKVGMTSEQVVEVLGSPNMVTTDDQRRETWVYDRVSTNVSSSSSGVWLLVIGGGSSSKSQTQRTLTIIVKFDAKGKVRDFAYRTATF